MARNERNRTDVLVIGAGAMGLILAALARGARAKRRTSGCARCFPNGCAGLENVAQIAVSRMKSAAS